jgi:hypothetical protein
MAETPRLQAITAAVEAVARAPRRAVRAAQTAVVRAQVPAAAAPIPTPAWAATVAAAPPRRSRAATALQEVPVAALLLAGPLDDEFFNLFPQTSAPNPSLSQHKNVNLQTLTDLVPAGVCIYSYIERFKA